eukprot:comp7106_c0_seq1/m.2834 comp7106_c0_seq1/g.2834  ORF comp7106_c0_seq1/g.2834 comp7106_c0_seq1/m.2834 type:complete len:367 (-) comp7106_c0_seq1:365-1465(-)
MASSRTPHGHNTQHAELNVDDPTIVREKALEDMGASVASVNQPGIPHTHAHAHIPTSTTTTTIPTSPRMKPLTTTTSSLTLPPTATKSTRHRRYIFVTVRSPLGAEYELRMRETDTLDRIKARIFARCDIPVTHQQLIFNGAELKDPFTTAKNFGIRMGSVITLMTRLQSGPLRMQADGLQENEDVLLDTVTSQLTEAQMTELFNKGQPVSLVAKVGGKYVLVKLRPQGDATRDSLESPHSQNRTLGAPVQETEDDWELKEQRAKENDRTKSKLDEIRARMAAKKSKITGPRAVKGPSVLDVLSNDFTAHRVRRRTSVDVLSEHRGSCGVCSASLGLVCRPCGCGKVLCPEHVEGQAHQCPFSNGV